MENNCVSHTSFWVKAGKLLMFKVSCQLKQNFFIFYINMYRRVTDEGKTQQAVCNAVYRLNQALW